MAETVGSGSCIDLAGHGRPEPDDGVQASSDDLARMPRWGASRTVIDLHTYLFNARFLPFQRVLQESGVPEWLAGPAERLFSHLAGKAVFLCGPHRAVIDGLGENDGLGPLADLLTHVASAEMAHRIVVNDLEELGGLRLERGSQAWRALRSDDLFAVLEEVESLAGPNSSSGATGHRAEVVGFLDRIPDHPDIRTLDRIGFQLSRRFRGALLWLLEELRSTIPGDQEGTSLDYLKAILLMLSDEAGLRKALRFGASEAQRGISEAHRMLLMQKALGNDNAYYRIFIEGIGRMAAIVTGGGPKFAGFAEYDLCRPDGFDVVKNALEGGCCGVKIYPSIGCPAPGSGTEQYTRFQVLIAHCARQRIPVVTHCSPVGFGAIEGSELFCDPDYWAGALEDHHDLTLCYGHAGGGGEKIVGSQTGSEVSCFGWCSENDEEWADENNFARKVVEHCCRFPNVFCDFSYFGAIVADRGRVTQLRRNLIAVLGGPTGDLHFGNKIMYGSYWHLPKMGPRGGEILAFWREIFDDPRISDFRDAFFFKNALRFLGAGPAFCGARIFSGT